MYQDANLVKIQLGTLTHVAGLEPSQNPRSSVSPLMDQNLVVWSQR